MNTFIKAISYYLPEKILTNEDLIVAFPEWDVDKTAASTGIKERHIAAEDETASDLGIQAAEKLFAEHKIDRQSVDFLLFVTQSPDHFSPTSACIMQYKLGLSASCGAMDVTLGCSGYVYGLSLAKALLHTKLAKNVLLITGDTITRYLHPNDHNHILFGDAATATLVSTEGFAKIGDFVLGTDGQGAENLIIAGGGMRQRTPLNDWHIDAKGNSKSTDHLFMDGEAIFNFTADAVPPLVSDTLLKNNMQQSDIDLFVFHQANRYMLNYMRKLIEIDKNKFFICLEKTGNTTSSTIPIALVEAQKQGVLHGNVLLAGFGVGYSWGATVISMTK